MTSFLPSSCKDFNKLLSLSEEIATIESIQRLLLWDEHTMLPKEGLPFRCKQKTFLSSLVHSKRTAKAFGRHLDKLIDIETGSYKKQGLNIKQKACLREWRQDYLQAISLPKSFIEKFSELKSQSCQAWIQAKKDNAFLQFAPFLEKIFSYSRKQAEYLGYQDHPYDALLGLYEAPFASYSPSFSKKKLNKLFSPIVKELTPLIKEIREKGRLPNIHLKGVLSEKKQWELARKLVHFVGLTEENTRLDSSAHPFCVPTGKGSIRLTSHYYPKKLQCLWAALHEAGHGLYEKNLLPEAFGTPLGQAHSMAVHESQSRFWETAIGLSYPFCRYLLPLLKKTFPKSLASFSAKKLYQWLTQLHFSPIRIFSHELFYNQHIIMRFELECALLEESLSVRDLPDAWREKSEKTLFLTPKNHQEGCLQDIHWAIGAVGYFPSYALGNIYMAQLFDAFKDKHPSWESSVQKGQSEEAQNWLSENIHQKGRLYSSSDLLKKATGRVPCASYLLSYLTEKYRSLYRLS